MSTVPTRRSSVTPSGICTKGASLTSAGIWPLPSFSRSPSWQFMISRQPQAFYVGSMTFDLSMHGARQGFDVTVHVHFPDGQTKDLEQRRG